MIEILHYLQDPLHIYIYIYIYIYGNGIFIRIMGNAGFISSTVVAGLGACEVPSVGS